MTDEELERKVEATLATFNEMLHICSEHGVKFDRAGARAVALVADGITSGHLSPKEEAIRHNNHQIFYGFSLTRVSHMDAGRPAAGRLELADD